MNPYEIWLGVDKAQNFFDIRMYEKMFHDKKIRENENLFNLIKQGLEMLYDERRELKVRKVHKVGEAGKALFGWS